jgi:hypothetical protein
VRDRRLESIVACVKVRCWATAPLAGGVDSRSLYHAAVAICQRRFAPRCASTDPYRPGKLHWWYVPHPKLSVRIASTTG